MFNINSNLNSNIKKSADDSFKTSDMRLFQFSEQDLDKLEKFDVNKINSSMIIQKTSDNQIIQNKESNEVIVRLSSIDNKYTSSINSNFEIKSPFNKAHHTRKKSEINSSDAESKINSELDVSSLSNLDDFFVEYFDRILEINHITDEDIIRNLLQEQRAKIKKIQFLNKSKIKSSLSKNLVTQLIKFIDAFDIKHISKVFTKIDTDFINLYLNLLQLWNNYYYNENQQPNNIEFAKVYLMEISFFYNLEKSYFKKDYQNLIDLKINLHKLFQKNEIIIIPIHVESIEDPKTNNLFMAKLDTKNKTVRIFDAKDVLSNNLDYGKVFFINLALI